MIYAISDIHGCCRELKELLKKIHFSGQDTLYFLGDYIDRGPDPIGVLRLISRYPNMIPLAGNHEVMMMDILPTALEKLEKNNLPKFNDKKFLRSYSYWIEDGGGTTAEQFRHLSEDDRDFYLDFVENMSLCEEVTVNGKKYMLSHSLPDAFCAGRDSIFDYSADEILFGRPEFHQPWTQDTTYIIGHTPTAIVPGAAKWKIFRQGNLIDIDCGCVYGGNLCAYCIDTGEVFYSPKMYGSDF